MTSRHSQAFIRIVSLFHLSAFSEAVSLARLIKAEIVSPYYGILINTGMGNLTVPLTVALGKQAIPNGQVGRRTASGASVKG